jgi:ubiquinone/menaquinone biosynthesis C-methylase UbiE
MSNIALSAGPAIHTGSPERFGYEWNEYAEMRPEYEEQFRRWTAHLAPEDWQGKSFLDVGCGMGRNSYWPMRYGAAESLSIDVDQRSLASARRTLADFPAARVEERSAYEIDEENRFDIAFSIGVIHHLAEPKRALAGMVKATKPGGKVLMWVYGFENNRWIVYGLTPWRRLLFCRLPIGVVHHLSLYPAILLWLALRLGLNSIEYFRLLQRLSLRHIRSIVFDQMLPRIANYWSRDEVEGMMREQGLVDVKLAWVNEMSWSAIGTKPAVLPDAEAPGATLDEVLPLLRSPDTGAALRRDGDSLVTTTGDRRYPISPSGIPLFAERPSSADARAQQAHYDAIAHAYVTNLGYPHTQEYTRYLDDALLAPIGGEPLGTVAEICCGRAEAFHLLRSRIGRGVGVDISISMLEAATREHAAPHLAFVQGDATDLPLASAGFDTVFMLGGIHHVNDRRALFAEVARILKPGGRFFYREPVSDFILWRWLRAVIYRLSPSLDHDTERPLLWRETVPVLEAQGLKSTHWATHGFLGFCLFMNSDVLVFNRLFRFVPGIRGLTRLAARLDAACLRLPLLRHAGLQVVGMAEKPAE